MDNYNIRQLTIITIITIIIAIVFFYLGVFSPLKNELENSLQNNFLNEVSITELSLENKFDRFIEAAKSISSRTMIKEKLIEYNNEKISLAELMAYTQPKYLDGVKALDNISAAYRIVENKNAAQYGKMNLEKIKANVDLSSKSLGFMITKTKDSVVINSPIISDKGDKVGEDIMLFTISDFMEKMNQNDINYEIIFSQEQLKNPLDQEEHIVDYRRILNTNYWLKAVESKRKLYNSLNSITAKIVIVFVILLIGFLVIFYKTIFNTFNQIISELKNKINKLNETKYLLENLTNQIPGALYQLQSKAEGGYFFPYASKGLKDLLGVCPEEVKENIELIYSKINNDDFENFFKSIEYSKENLTTWHSIFRVNTEQKGLRWLEGSAQPEKLNNGEVLWHGYARDITERKKEKDRLEMQHDFQKALAEISSKLVNLSSENFDNKIDRSLAIIGNFFAIEYIHILKLSEDKKSFSSIHDWHKDNKRSSKKEFQNLSTAKIPWWIEQVKKRNYFTVCDIENLPQAAEKDKKFLKSKNIKSAASIAIKIDNNLFGWYAFGNIKEKGICESTKIKYINIFTEVITRAIVKNLNDRKIEKLTYYDSLTNLYNRRFFEEEMKRLDTARNLPFSILMADLNGLKIINDSYGHDKGDQILKKAAQILKNSLRKEEILARPGGDEFAALLPKTSKKEAEKIVERIKKNLNKTKSDKIPISIAIGTATKENQAEDINEIFKKADDKMYQNKLAESRSSKSNIVEGLINTLNAKSSETKEHALRMRELAFEFGESLKLSNSEQNRLSILATLHDIGKTNINEKILKKKSHLTDQEWELVKKHPEYGYKIASSSEEFSAVAEDILAHHEKWDGSGYPGALSGEDIPYLARIISIIDAYDVMTHERPYSQAISKQEALREISNSAGTQFDPELAAAFVEMMKKKLADSS